MHTQHHIPAPSCIKGFTLLEVLIALLIFSIGLLGLAGMQIQGLKYNHSAYMRSQATLLAYDILDRMRSNRTEADSGGYAVTTAATFTPSVCTGNTATCTSTQMATFDKYEWKQALRDRLPNGNGSVVLETAGVVPPIFIISVQWNDEKDLSVVQTFILRTAP